MTEKQYESYSCAHVRLVSSPFNFMPVAGNQCFYHLCIISSPLLVIWHPLRLMMSVTVALISALRALRWTWAWRHPSPLTWLIELWKKEDWDNVYAVKGWAEVRQDSSMASSQWHQRWRNDQTLNCNALISHNNPLQEQIYSPYEKKSHVTLLTLMM